MDDNKAPGPDGYTSAFFKKSWSIVGEDFCSAVKDFFASGEILKQINHSTIALVPKSANANTAADYRPISCCNVTYKVISKLLAERLSHVLNDIISPSQNAFLGGRLMADNINLMQELLRMYGRKRVSPRCTIKIDFRKAFDTVQWSFLRDLLHLLGFPAIWRLPLTLFALMVIFSGTSKASVVLDKEIHYLPISSLSAWSTSLDS